MINFLNFSSEGHVLKVHFPLSIFSHHLSTPAFFFCLFFFYFFDDPQALKSRIYIYVSSTKKKKKARRTMAAPSIFLCLTGLLSKRNLNFLPTINPVRLHFVPWPKPPISFIPLLKHKFASPRIAVSAFSTLNYPQVTCT